MGKTNIEWTRGDDGSQGMAWNPVMGCRRVSAGCEHCYAEVIAARFSGPGLAFEGIARRRSNGEAQWTGNSAVNYRTLNAPLGWRRPRRVFVNSMSDLFYEQFSTGTIAHVFAVMALASRHTFQVLTKRPERMRDLLNDPDFAVETIKRVREIARSRHDVQAGEDAIAWPLPNVWLGVSVENQEAANERIPLLMETRAAVRFLSCEPLLGSIDFTGIGKRFCVQAISRNRGKPTLDWIIVGGESGRGARECDLAWVRNIVAQCANGGVPCFVKQLGANPIDPWADTGALVMDRRPVKPQFRNAKGGDMGEWPEDLRVREFPTAAVTA